MKTDLEIAMYGRLAGARCLVRLVLGVGRGAGRRARGYVGSRAPAVRGARHARTRPRRVLRRHRRQGTIT